MTLSSSGGNTYSFTILSSYGIVGPISPTLITPSGATHSGTFVQIFPNYGAPICFTIIATDTLTAGQCSLEVCINPEECDPSWYRLINTAEVLLYPNPATELTIAKYVMDDDKGINELVLSDLQGRIIFTERLKDVKGEVQINTANLTPGMYFLSAKNNGTSLLIKKLIIEK